jgi:hypothetical protein
MTDRTEEQETEPSNSVANVSGGVNVESQREVNIGGDAVGRDKTVSAGTYIEHYYAGGEATPSKSTKLVAKGRMPNKRIIIEVLVGVALAAIFILALLTRPAPLILTNSNWNDYVQDSVGSSLSLQAIPGTDHALAINFDLKAGGWTGIYKKLSLPPFKSIKVQYKGTGAPNTIELKLIDKNETVFEAIQAHTTNTNGQSQPWGIEYSEFRCRKGSALCQDDNAVRSLTLKPEDLDRMDISFSNKSEHADEAGSGQVTIEEIQFSP